jgi:hypothetical protein
LAELIAPSEWGQEMHRRSRSIAGLVFPIAALVVQCSFAQAAGGKPTLGTPASPPPSSSQAAPAVSTPTAPTPTAPATGAGTAPAAIPVAEVATRAAQVPNLLRSLTQQLATSTEIETIRRRLHTVHERMDIELVAAEAILRAQPTLDVSRRCSG